MIGPRFALIGFVSILVLTGCAVIPPYGPATSAPAPSAPSSAPASPASSPSNDPSPSPTTATPTPDTRRGKELNQPYQVNGVIVVSKKHRISATYGPASPTGPYRLDKTMAAALAKMTAAAKADGVKVIVKSGYRSYSQQKAIYDRALQTQPQNINFYAPPGASEHQTGLSADLWDGKVWYRPMENSAAGKWLHAHAHEYGFILRFPKGKEKITGVPYEPWHFRYVGVEVSGQFDKGNKLTLEEFLGLD